MDQLIFAILLVVATTNLILCGMIVSRGIRTFSNLLFSLIALCLVVWSIGIVGFYHDQFANLINWVIVTHVAALLISVFFLIFSASFPRPHTSRTKLLIISSALTLISIYLISGTSFIIGDTTNRTYHLGSGYPFYALLVSAFFILGYKFLYDQYRTSTSETEKMQIIYILIGSFVASTLAMIPDLILPYFNVFQFTWLGPIFTLLMVISLFVAMLKFQLFNVKVIFTEVASAIIVVAILLELFYSQTPADIFLQSVVLIIVSLFSFLQIKSAYNEIKQKEELRIANDNQKNLIHIMNHQIKGYLGKARNIFAELLTTDYGVIPATAKPLITEGFQQCTKGVDYVQTILKGVSAASGLLPYDMKPVDITSLVNSVINEQRNVAEQKNIKFTTQIFAKEIKIIGDSVQLSEAFRNLIENAIKYNRPNGNVFIKLERDTQFVEFSVKDTGYGVENDVKNRLFTPGGRSKNSIKYNPDSSGFGLAFVKGVIEKHGGKVWYSNNSDGYGSTFVVEIPFHQKIT